MQLDTRGITFNFSSWKELASASRALPPEEILKLDLSFAAPQLNSLITEVSQIYLRVHSNDAAKQHVGFILDEILETKENFTKTQKLSYREYLACCSQYLIACSIAQSPNNPVDLLRYTEHTNNTPEIDRMYAQMNESPYQLDTSPTLSGVREFIERRVNSFEQFALNLLEGNVGYGWRPGFLAPIINMHSYHAATEGLSYRDMNKFDDAGCWILELIPWDDIRQADGNRMNAVGFVAHDILHIKSANSFPTKNPDDSYVKLDHIPPQPLEASGISIANLSFDDFSQVAKTFGFSDEDTQFTYFVLRHEVYGIHDVALLRGLSETRDPRQHGPLLHMATGTPGLEGALFDLQHSPVQEFITSIGEAFGIQNVTPAPLSNDEWKAARDLEVLIRFRIEAIEGLDAYTPPFAQKHGQEAFINTIVAILYSVGNRKQNDSQAA